jgi:hypothetical protein
MTTCPKCSQAVLLEIRDFNPKLSEYICPLCTYYQSNSDAYHTSPRMFDHLGKVILTGLETELASLGLTLEQVRAWAQGEESFAKRNFTALDPKRRLYRTSAGALVT